MKLEVAQVAAEQFIQLIQHTCIKVEVAGSVRRGKPEVNDIDLVVIEKLDSLATLSQAITLLGNVISDGPKIKRLMWDYGDGDDLANIDIYVATPETWATMMLIRTGSKENNIRLCTHARDMGYHLHASGAGLYDQQAKLVAGETEESIYEALELPYQTPGER